MGIDSATSGRRRRRRGLMDQLAAVLKEIIKVDGISLRQMASDTGLSADQLSRFIRRERNLSGDTIDVLTRHYGIELVYYRPKKPTT